MDGPAGFRFRLAADPVGSWKHRVARRALATTWLVERNNRGIKLEKKKEIEAAIIIYELSVGDAFFGTHPYDRLGIIYGRRPWYNDAIRVCRAYLHLPDRPHGQDKSHFERHLKKLLAKT